MTVQELLKRAGIQSVEELQDPSAMSRFSDLGPRPMPVQTQADPRTQVFEHDHGNTVIVDNRPRFDPAEINRQNAIRHAQDPSWYPSNTNSPLDMAGDMHKMELAKKVLQFREQGEQKDYFVRTLRDKIARRDIYQNPADGSWQEIMEEPDELGQMKRVARPISIETAGMLAKVGGPDALGIPDVRQMNALKAMIQPRGDLKDYKTTPAQLPPSEPESYPPLAGIPQAIGNLNESAIRGTYRERLEDGSGRIPLDAMIGVQAKNLLKRLVTGGTPEAMPDVTDDRNERQMVNVLRERKNLGPISDAMWQEYLANRAAQQSNRGVFNSPMPINNQTMPRPRY